jgi:hypothetical protein
MAGAVYLVNPRKHRRKSRRRATRARAHRRTRRARRNPIFTNARRRSTRRRRRNPIFTNARRHHVKRRRRHHNPRILGMSLGGGLMGGLKVGGGVAMGAILTNLATGAVIHYGGAMIPAQVQSGVGKMGLKLAVGVVALPMVLKALKQPGLARNAAIGAWAVIVIDAYNEFLAPMVEKSLGFSDYETGTLSSYETGTLSAYPIGGMVAPGAGANTYAGGVYGEIA